MQMITCEDVGLHHYKDTRIACRKMTNMKLLCYILHSIFHITDSQMSFQVNSLTLVKKIYIYCSYQRKEFILLAVTLWRNSQSVHAGAKTANNKLLSDSRVSQQ